MPRILIATEDAALNAILSAECAGEGHETHWALTGYEAVEMAQALGPDIVFLDTALAVYNGFETCTMLREDPAIPQSLPILLLTDDEISPHLLQRTHATGIFPKTHAAAELRELLAEKLQHTDRLARERDALQS